MRLSHLLLLLPRVILLGLLFMPDTGGFFKIKSLNDKIYMQEGDLNIGGLISITDREPRQRCGEKVSDFFRIDMVESLVYFIREANKRYLPKLKLGFIIADACNRESIAAVQALRFLPLSELNEGVVYINESLKGGVFRSFSVVGVIGTDASFTTKPAAIVLSTSDVPLISFRATADSLSDPVLFPNFFRTVTPDLIHLQGMAHYLKEKRWIYFSVVYTSENLLQSLYEQIRLVMSEAEFCVDRLIYVTSQSNFSKVLDQLTGDRPHPTKIILVLTGHYISKVLIKAIHQMNLNRSLLWFGLDSWLNLMFEERAPNGSLAIGYTAAGDDATSAISNLAELTLDTPNPWFKAALKHVNCSTVDCYKDLLATRYHENPSLTSMIYKTVDVLVWSLSAFLEDHCPMKVSGDILVCFHKHSDLFSRFIRSAAVKYPWVMETLHTDDGSHGRLSIYQLVMQEDQRLLQLASFDVREQTFTHDNDVDDRPFLFSPVELRPYNICRPTCEFGEFQSLVSPCCWSCKKCQEGQFTSENGFFCDHCQPLFWPEQTNRNESVCSEIMPDFYTKSQPLSVCLLVATLLGVLLVVAVFFWYVMNRSNNLVKASSAELNYIHLLTFLGGYLSVPIFLSEPTHTNCNLGLFLFTSSFNISYMIMVTKAVRVYRIFTMSVKRMRVSYISYRFHIAVCLGFLLEEVSRFWITAHFFPIESALIQPQFNVEYVEKTCLVPPFHMVTFVATGFLLLLLCLLFAFKTQTLPSRFRESLYVTNCVMTSLIVWSCFLPAYFTSFYHNTRVLYVIFAVIIQNNMTLALIFISRLLLVEYIKGHGVLSDIVIFLCY
ncbi:hypothetical protein Btru_052733 [Bulinus truncatus]|nr:hypothetical protein Btru_052733 [Bulinus truncatus]